MKNTIGSSDINADFLLPSALHCLVLIICSVGGKRRIYYRKLRNASMPSVYLAQLNLGFRSRTGIPSIDTVKVSPGASPASSKLRDRGIPSLRIKRRPLIVSAAYANSRDEKSSINGSKEKETSNAGQGPPLLTISAGFFVLFLLGWIIWSILSWLIRLIVNVPPPK